MVIHFGAETYLEGITMDRDLFYRKIQTEGVMPTSSQPSPGQFADAYRPLGSDPILCLTITSKHSGTYQSAVLAAGMVAGADVVVFDTLSITMGTGFMVLEAARMAEAGHSREEILARLEQVRAGMYIVFTPDTLKYLQMSGRVGKLSGVLGSMLNLRPIITIEDGLLEAKEKVRTRGRSLERLVEMMAERIGTDAPAGLAVIHARIPEEAQALAARLSGTFQCADVPVVDLVPVLAVHGGPGIIGIVGYPL
jgi:DegV family protein with EDD domain